MLKRDFNNVAFYEITIWHVCSPVNLRHIFIISFHKNNSGGLLRDTDANKFC